MVCVCVWCVCVCARACVCVYMGVYGRDLEEVAIHLNGGVVLLEEHIAAPIT
jgi:hypothetical protein